MFHDQHPVERTHSNDFAKYGFNMGLGWGTYGLIYFKLCIVINTSKLYSLIPVLMGLTITEGGEMRNLELVQ